METATNSKSRTLILTAVVGVVVAGAIGAAFMLGGQTGSSGEDLTASRNVQASSTASSPEQTDVSASNPPQGGQQASQDTGGLPAGDGSQPDAGGQADEPVVSQTPVPEDADEEESPTDTPTATPTSTPWGPDDIAPQPTSTPNPDPCPLCVDAELGGPIDTQPVISNITTSFCYPNLVMLFDLAFADAVWFTYVDGGVTHHSTHIDADTFIGFLSDDVSSLGWGALLIDNIRIHATDDDGDHTVSDEIPLPEMEFC